MSKTSGETSIEQWPNTLSKPLKIRWRNRSFIRRNGDGNYYVAVFVVKGKQKTFLLHRLIWESKNGKIPRNFQIHHIDGNPFNNHLDNLEIVNRSLHKTMHLNEMNIKTPGWWKKGLEKARLEAKKWHASLDGKSWHSKHGEKTWEKRKKFEKICPECKKKYQTYWKTKNKFCSKRCAQRVWARNNKDKFKKYRIKYKEKRSLLSKQLKKQL